MLVIKGDGEKRWAPQVGPYISRANALVDAVLLEAETKAGDIDHVLLVGGSTRIPYIQEQLKKKFGEILSQEVNPDEAVALGAALVLPWPLASPLPRRFRGFLAPGVLVTSSDLIV